MAATPEEYQVETSSSDGSDEDAEISYGPQPWDSNDDLNLDHIKPGLEWW